MPERPATLARPRHLRVVLCLLLASSVSAPVAQERVYAPLVQRTRTTLVLVDVRVEDRAGNAVHGLTKEDFILRLDKKTVPIASFDEVLATDPPEAAADPASGGEAPTYEPGYFIFFFDNVSSNRFQQSAAGVAADGVFATLQPEDRFMAIGIGRNVKVIHPMSRVEEATFESMSQLLADPAIADAFQEERQFRMREIADLMERAAQDPTLRDQLIRQAQFLARAYSTQDGNRIHTVLDAVRGMLIALEPIRERKTLLYLSAGLPQYPGGDYLAAAGLSNEIAQGTRETSFALQRLFREANSGRTSIYPIDASGLTASFRPAANANQFTGERDALISLALNTGGKAIFNTNDMAGALQPALAASRHYYLLGITPDLGGDGEYHKIEVRTKRSGLRVAARAGFINFSSQEMDEREVLGSYLVPEMFDAIPLQVDVVPLEMRGRVWHAVAQIQLPVTALDRLPQGDGAAGQVEIGTTLFRMSTMSGRFNRAMTLRFPAGESPSDSAQVVFQQPFRLKPGSYVGISVARDGVTGLRGGSRVEFDLPDGDRHGLHPVLGRLPGADILSLPPENDDFARKTATPALDRKLIWAAPGNARFVPDDVIFVAYLLPGTAASPPSVTHQLFRDDAEVALRQKHTLEFTGEEDEDVMVYQEIRARDLGPGRYSVTVGVGEGDRARAAEVAFEILPDPAAASGAVTFEYVAHACFRITSPSGHTVLIDPFESQWWLGYDFPAGLPATDAVLITHPHSDHDGGMAAGRDLPWKPETHVLTEAGEFRLGEIRILGVAGKHADPYGKEFGQTNTIWVLEIAGLRIVHVGDNGPLTDAVADQISGADVLMLPIDSDYHILKRDEIEAYRARLAPAILIPMHYRHPDLETEDDSPDDLGELHAWLETERSVRQVGSHTVTLSLDALPSIPQVLVLEHSPKVVAPIQGPAE